VRFLIFNSGKYIITGARNVKQIYKAVDMLKELSNDIEVHIEREPSVTTQNIMASGKIMTGLACFRWINQVERVSNKKIDSFGSFGH